MGTCRPQDPGRYSKRWGLLPSSPDSASIPRAPPSLFRVQGASVDSLSAVRVKRRPGVAVPSGVGPSKEQLSVGKTHPALHSGVDSLGVLGHLGSGKWKTVRTGTPGLAPVFCGPCLGTVSLNSVLSLPLCRSLVLSEAPATGAPPLRPFRIWFSDSLQTQSLVLENHRRPGTQEETGESGEGGCRWRGVGRSWRRPHPQSLRAGLPGLAPPSPGWEPARAPDLGLCVIVKSQF